MLLYLHPLPHLSLTHLHHLQPRLKLPLTLNLHLLSLIMPRLTLQMILNRRRNLQTQQDTLRREVIYSERYAFCQKTPIVIPYLGRFNGRLNQALHSAPLDWSQYNSTLDLLNTPLARLNYPMMVWENLISAMQVQEEWLQSWAYLVAEAQNLVLENPEVRTFIRSLRINGLLLIFPPYVINSNSSVELADTPDNLVTQHIAYRSMIATEVSYKLRGTNLNGVSFLGTWDLKAINVSVVSSLQLVTGSLNYRVNCKPIGSGTGVVAAPDSSSAVDQVGQNFSSDTLSMDPLNILAWNVRGAASREFRRIFIELVNRHKPNVILLTETRVGGARAQQFWIPWVLVTTSRLILWGMREAYGCSGIALRLTCRSKEAPSRRFMPLRRYSIFRRSCCLSFMLALLGKEEIFSGKILKVSLLLTLCPGLLGVISMMLWLLMKNGGVGLLPRLELILLRLVWMLVV